MDTRTIDGIKSSLEKSRPRTIRAWKMSQLEADGQTWSTTKRRNGPEETMPDKETSCFVRTIVVVALQFIVFFLALLLVERVVAHVHFSGASLLHPSLSSYRKFACSC